MLNCHCTISQTCNHNYKHKHFWRSSQVSARNLTPFRWATRSNSIRTLKLAIAQNTFSNALSYLLNCNRLEICVEWVTLATVEGDRKFLKCIVKMIWRMCCSVFCFIWQEKLFKNLLLQRQSSGSAAIFYTVLSVNTVTLGKESNFKSWDDTAKLQHCSTVSVSASQKHTNCTSLCF